MQNAKKQAKTTNVFVAPQAPLVTVAPVAQPATLLLAAPVAPLHTVVQPATLRATRMLQVTNALYRNRIAAKHAMHASNAVAANLAAYNAAVAALQAQHGITTPPAPTVQPGLRTLNGYATNIAAKNPPSVAVGSCAQVHQIAAQYGFNRAATLQACMVAGINPATAATQFNIARKRNIAAQQG